MNLGYSIANSFYHAFSKSDSAGMNVHYAEGATFSDPIFMELSEFEVRGMWEMLCSSAKDFRLSYQIVDASDTHVQVEWTATYSFGPRNRRVENRVSTLMEIVSGKITRQVDTFSFSRWATQAIGPIGFILGFFPFFRKKVQTNARAKLSEHLKKSLHAES
ncbi:MAG: hypothetical protein RJB13_94 [Pseudomonadota bacterium]|jgi:hypothetical protein